MQIWGIKIGVWWLVVVDETPAGSFAIPRAFHKQMNFDQRPISTDLKPKGPI
jgi:hypothetical protein